MQTQLMFTPSMTRVCTDVSIFDDNEVEGVEVFEVSLSVDSEDVFLSPEVTLVIIVDDDESKSLLHVL